MLDHIALIPDLEVMVCTKPYLKYCLRGVRADLVHAHEAKAAQWAYCHYLRNRIPYVLTRRILKAPGNNFFTRNVHTHARKVIAVSHAVATVMQHAFAIEDTVVIPSMCTSFIANPQKIIELRARYHNKYIVGHIGALVEHDKGQSYIIEAARQLQNELPDVHFLLMGSGPDEARLRALARGLSNLEFLGQQNELGSYLGVFDTFILPSLQEGLGSILLDALQFGKPILATCIGGIPDIICHGENGLLIPPADAGAIRKGLIELYHNRALRQQLGENAYKSAERYRPEVRVSEYLELYQNALKATG